MLRMRRFSGLVLSAFCLLLFAGCGGKKAVEVKGKLILPAGLKLLPKDSVKIALVPEDPSGTASGGALSNADMTFSTREGKSPGSVPGKYKVTVKMSAYLGEAGTQKRDEVFKPFNKFYDATKTPLRYEVTEDLGQSITIDLAKNTVTKD